MSSSFRGPKESVVLTNEDYAKRYQNNFIGPVTLNVPSNPDWYNYIYGHPADNDSGLISLYFIDPVITKCSFNQALVKVFSYLAGGGFSNIYIQIYEFLDEFNVTKVAGGFFKFKTFPQVTGTINSTNDFNNRIYPYLLSCKSQLKEGFTLYPGRRYALAYGAAGAHVISASSVPMTGKAVGDLSGAASQTGPELPFGSWGAVIMVNKQITEEGDFPQTANLAQQSLDFKKSNNMSKAKNALNTNYAIPNVQFTNDKLHAIMR